MQKTKLLSPAFAVIAIIFIVVALYFPLSLATNSDFRVLYYTDKALLNGIDVYDHAAKTEFVAQQEGIKLEEVLAFPQFAYPPWLALGTFFLGFMSIQSAATLWFELNVSMLLLAVWYLSDDWPAKKRLSAFLAVFLFIPVLGTLVVGQYDFPTLLGAAMLLYAIKKEKPILTALGIFSLTFKPHLGGLLILVLLIYLFLRRDRFGADSLKATLIVAGIAFAIGFLADSSWLLDYVNSLLGYSELGHITSCSECANLSIWLARWVTGELSLSIALRAGVVILTVEFALLYFLCPALYRSAALLINAVIFITLLASPYLYNYDYLLLLVPMLWLAGGTLNWIEWSLLAVAWILPMPALLIYGRDGNISFLFVMLILIWLFMQRNKIETAA